ncbi:t-SNARE [Naematelia encephala]|uniref:t-SNARE n=1 Tax=Naematelia encephala TaxID=71784 RepID=A0A1Y2AXA8_9TREE|nr:t-SNARE [Naematelia encephala]
MSRDPYEDVKREVEHNLSTTNTLYETYRRTPDQSTLDELKNTVQLLQGDIEDLEESVRAVETIGDRWGIGAQEISRRRAFVERVKADVRDLRSRFSKKGKERAYSYRDVEDDNDVEEARRWEMEEQQTLVTRQDDTLGVISGTLHTLASQAGLIGSEVAQQSEMLDDLGNRVDNTDSRLRKVTRKMEDFIRRNEETKSGWLICILIFVLIVLLVLVIIT